MGKTSKHAMEKQKSGKGIKFIIFLIIFVIIVAIASVAWYNICLSGTGTSDESVAFEIEFGSGASKIASVLKTNGVIRSEFAFKLYVKLNNITKFQAGKYTITKDMTVPEIVDSLQKRNTI